MLDLLNSTVPIHGRKIVREERQGRRKREKVGRSGEVAKSSRSQGACHACQLKPPAWASCCFLDPTDPAQSSPLSLIGSRLLQESWSTWVHPPPTDRASRCPRDTSVSPLQAQESMEHLLPPLTPPQQDQRSNSPQARPGQDQGPGCTTGQALLHVQ